MVTAEYRVSSRQVLSPNPSASAIEACLGPHQGYLLLAAVPPPPPVVLVLVPLPPLEPPLLHAVRAREAAASAEAPMSRRDLRLVRPAGCCFMSESLLKRPG